MRLLSDLYNITLKRGIRGKAKEGFIRPTIGQNFMTHRDFEEILSNRPITEVRTASEKLSDRRSNAISVVTIDSNRVAVCYAESIFGTGGFVRIGTSSGDKSISWGEPINFSSLSTSYWVSAVLLDVNHICIAYFTENKDIRGIIGTISGDTITWGNEYIFKTRISEFLQFIYLSNVQIDENRFLLSFTDLSNSSYGTSVVGTVQNGNEISWGSPYVFNSARSEWMTAVKIAENRICISYRDWANSSYGTTIIGTIVNGNEISWGPTSVYNSRTTWHTSELIKLDNNHVVISYQDYGNNYLGTSSIGTIVNGNEIYWGPESQYVFNSGFTEYITASRIDESRFLVAYRDKATITGMFRIGTVTDGNIISWGELGTFNNTYHENISSNLVNNSICIASANNTYQLAVTAAIIELYLYSAPTSTATVPEPPTIGTVSLSTTSPLTAEIPFTAPSNDGGSTILAYTAISSPGGLISSIGQSESGMIEISGLTAGTPYTFTVKASNAVGDSVWSVISNQITP